MSSKSGRRAARETVWTYDEAQLAGLVARIGEAIDSYRVKELDPYEIDEVLAPLFGVGEGTVEVLQPHAG